MKPLLKVRNLTKYFGGLAAVEDVSISLRPGSITALLGPNGAGKSTVFNLVSGYIPADRGTIIFNSTNITGTKPFKIADMGIGRLFQDIRVFEDMSVIDNVIMGFKNYHFEKPLFGLLNSNKQRMQMKETREKAIDLINFMDLYSHRNELAGELSGGQQKLLTIARLLAFESELLLLDEPTAGVAPGIESKILSLLRKLVEEQNKTILIIEHRMNVVLKISDWAFFMDNGQKVAEGAPKHVLESAEVRRSYIGI